MMYKILFPILLIGMFTVEPAFAQKDTKAKELLDKSSQAINQAGGISITFSLEMNDEVNREKHSVEGQLFLKGAKFFLDTPEQTVYYDGKTQWAYVKTIDEVSILEPQPQDLQALNPISIFEFYKNECDYMYKGGKSDIQKQKVEEISLSPKNKKDDISRIDIQINSSDYMPVFFRIIHKNKLEYCIYIKKYQTKLNLPDSQFVFDKKKYPQAEVNDLR